MPGRTGKKKIIKQELIENMITMSELKYKSYQTKKRAALQSEERKSGGCVITLSRKAFTSENVPERSVFTV